MYLNSYWKTELTPTFVHENFKAWLEEKKQQQK